MTYCQKGAQHQNNISPFICLMSSFAKKQFCLRVHTMSMASSNVVTEIQSLTKNPDGDELLPKQYHHF